MCDQPYVYCGTWLNEGCLNIEKHNGFQDLRNVNSSGKIYRRTFQKSCYRQSCKICFKKWLFRESNKATHKITTLSKKIKKKVVHVIISPSRKDNSTSTSDLRKKAYKLLSNSLQNKDDLAGCLIFHPARLNKVNNSWYASPHFHCLSFGWIDGQKVRAIHKKTGWIVKNKGIRKSVFATILYQLSHSGLKKGNHSITWFGGLSYSSIAKYNPECQPMEQKEHFCPICKVKLKPILWCLQEKDPPGGEFDGFDEPSGWLTYKKVSCL